MVFRRVTHYHTSSFVVLVILVISRKDKVDTFCNNYFLYMYNYVICMLVNIYNNVILVKLTDIDLFVTRLVKFFMENELFFI